MWSYTYKDVFSVPEITHCATCSVPETNLAPSCGQWLSLVWVIHSISGSLRDNKCCHWLKAQRSELVCELNLGLWQHRRYGTSTTRQTKLCWEHEPVNQRREKRQYSLVSIICIHTYPIIDQGQGPSKAENSLPLIRQVTIDSDYTISGRDSCVAGQYVQTHNAAQGNSSDLKSHPITRLDDV